MKNILATIAIGFMFLFIACLLLFIIATGVDQIYVMNNTEGQYLYEGNTWMDEKALATLMFEYGESQFEIQDIKPNTALVEYYFVSPTLHADLSYSVLSFKNFEVHSHLAISIACFFVFTIAIVLLVFACTNSRWDNSHEGDKE